MTDEEMAAAGAPRGLTDEGMAGPAPAKPGFFRRAYESVKGGVKAVGHVYKDQADLEARAVMHPQETFGTPEGRARAEQDFILTNPSKRREFERGVSDVVTLGYANPLIKDTEQADAAAAPQYRAAGNVAGGFLPSPVSLIGKGAGAVIGKALPQATSIAGRTAVNVAKGLGSYEASVPLAAAASAGAEGDRLGAAERAATDPAGLLLSGGIPAATTAAAETTAAVGRRGARAIRDTRTETGRTIADVEAAGGHTKPIGSPTAGGFYDTPESQQLSRGKAGYNDLADTQAQRMNAASEQRLKDLRQGYGHALEQRLAHNADEYHVVQDTHDLLARLQDENSVNGEVGNPELQKAIDKTRRMLTSSTADMGTPRAAPPPVPAAADPRNARGYEPPNFSTEEWRKLQGEWDASQPGNTTEAAVGRGRTVPDAQYHAAQELGGAPTQPSARTVPTDEPAVDLPAVKVRDLVKVKRIVNDLSEHGQPATAENRPYRLIAKSLGQELEQIDPEIAKLNQHYATETSKLERQNDIVYGANKADVGSRAARERRAALFLGRAGDETQAATGASARQLDEVAALAPENQDAITKVRAKKAEERLRYGFPRVSTSIERVPHHFISHNLEAVKARVALPVAESMARARAPQNPVANFPGAVRIGVEAKRKKEKEQR